MKAIIFDCEIVKAIPSSKEPRIEGIEYCGGWGSHDDMGISVIGVYEYGVDQYHVFMRDNFPAFIDLVKSCDLCIGFNNIGFDNKLVKAVLGHDINNSYDLLSEVWQAAGLPSYFAGSKSGGYGLDACAVANGLPGKTGKGALAPVLWQQGKFGTVCDYCLNDVAVTRKLIDKVLAGTFLDPKTGRWLNVKKPWEIKSPVPC
jgi:hypothetical protein